MPGTSTHVRSPLVDREIALKSVKYVLMVSDTELADRMAAQNVATQTAPEPPVQTTPSPSQSSRWARPGTPKGKAAASSETTNLPLNTTQLRAELAHALKARADLEAKFSAINEEITAFKTTNEEQAKRIVQLEKAKEFLERRARDRADELKGKGSFIDNVQNDLVALTLEHNMVQQENEKLRRENQGLQRRWMELMEKEREKADEEHQQFAARKKR
jgi:chromosome segregation ATPase